MNGIIKFDSNPSNTQIYLNDKYVGETPLDITDVKPGLYTYSIERDKDLIFSSNLTVQPGKIIHIIADFVNNTLFKENLDIPSPDTDKSSQGELSVIEEQQPIETSSSSPKESSVIEEQPPIETSSSSPKESSVIEEQPATETQLLLDEKQEKLPEESSTIEKHSATESILKQLQKSNDLLSEISEKVRITPKSVRTNVYDKTDFILTSVPVKPNDIISGEYQMEKIHETLGNNAEAIHVHNYGPGLLYVIISTDGIQFKDETFILEGEGKNYRNVYSIGLRSPTAHLQYKVTERDLMLYGGASFTASRFRDRRDRKGVTLFEDDMESPTLKFSTAITGAGTIARSIDTSYYGDFSIKAVIGLNAGDENVLVYSHTDFHQSKLGVQIRFSGALLNTSFSVAISMIFINSTSSNTGTVQIMSNGQIRILNASGNMELVNTIPTLVSNPTTWHVIKLVIDISSFYYVNATVNGITTDLRSFPLNRDMTGGSPRQELEVDITATGPTAGGATTVYFDNYISTEDEPEF